MQHSPDNSAAILLSKRCRMPKTLLNLMKYILLVNCLLFIQSINHNPFSCKKFLGKIINKIYNWVLFKNRYLSTVNIGPRLQFEGEHRKTKVHCSKRFHSRSQLWILFNILNEKFKNSVIAIPILCSTHSIASWT